MSSALTSLLPVVAQNAQAAPAFDPFLIIMLAFFAIMIFFMFRRGKKAQEQQQQMRSSLAPGSEVMTTMGLFGTVRSIDAEQNRVVLEISPGVTATVHMQAIGQVVEPETTATAASTDAAATDAAYGTTAEQGATVSDPTVSGSTQAADPVVPDDLSGLQDPRDPRQPGDSTDGYGRPQA